MRVDPVCRGRATRRGPSRNVGSTPGCLTLGVLLVAGLANRLPSQTRWGDWQLLTPRANAGLVHDAQRDRLVLFGGSYARGTSRVALNDTAEWDGRGWVRRRTQSNPLPPTVGRALIYDPVRQRSVLFGMVNNTPQTWAYGGRDWLLLNPARSPPVHEGYATGFDPVRNRLVLFGGASAQGPQLELWEFDGTNWQQAASAGPSGRNDAAMAWDEVRGTLVLFGGRSTEVGAQPLDDMWEWDGLAWRRITPATLPPARHGHALASDTLRKRLVLFGGRSAGAGSERSDTWEWDGTAWAQIAGAAAPAARAGAAMAYDATARVVTLVGGEDATTALADTWTFDGADWREVAAAPAPSPRAEHAATLDSARAEFLLFGGRDAANRGQSDTWVWRDARWSRRMPVTSPPARFDHALEFDAARARAVLFGGQGGTATLDDTWLWDGLDWTRATPLARPSARRSHAMAYDRRRGVIVLFGGVSGGSLGDTWEWDGSAWAQRSPAAAPLARSEHAMTYDAANQRIVLIGGRAANGVYLSDAWAFDGATWTNVPALALPTPRGEHALAFDERRGRFYVFGGWTGTAGTRLADSRESTGSGWTIVPGFVAPFSRSGHTLTHEPTQRRTLLFGGESAQFGLLSDTWSLSGSPISDFQPIANSGCGRAIGIPPATIDAFGVPSSGNSNFALDLFTQPPITTPLPVFFLLSAAQGSGSVAGCGIAVDPGTLLATLYRLQYGRFVSQALPLPHNAALLGASLFVQAAHVDPPAELNGLVLSVGYRLTIGERGGL